MADSQDIIWANGKLILDEHYRLSPMAPGLAVGLGCFETLAAYRGIPLFLDRHLKRLFEGAARLGFQVPDPSTLEDAVAEVIGENGLDNEPVSRLRISAMALDLEGEASVTISAVPQAGSPETMTVTVSDYRRNELGALTGIKSSSYAENTVALREARREGFDEALMLNSRGDLSEGTLSNVFLVNGGKVTTPELKSGCLPGVTRALVLELATKWGIPYEEVCIPSHEIFMAEEIFVTNSVLGICPVSRIDQRELEPGRITTKLRGAYQSLIESLIEN